MIREREYDALCRACPSLLGLLALIVAGCLRRSSPARGRSPPPLVVGVGAGARCCRIFLLDGPVRRQSERGPRCCSSSAATPARSSTPDCAGRTRSTPRSGSRCGSATSRARTSRSTTTTATRSRSPPSSSGGSSTPPKRCSRSTTTTTTSRCRPKRRCATWRRATPTTRTTRRRCRCAATPPRSPST